MEGKYATMAATAEKDKSQKEISATFRKWGKAGDSIVGKFLSRFPVSGTDKHSYMHYIMDTDAGLIKMFCGGVFDNDAGAMMRVGGVYKITFIEKQDLKGGHTVNVFKTLEIAAPEREPGID